MKLNFKDRLKKCKQILDSWKCRNLTLIVKTLVIRTFIISQFLYTVSAIKMPEKYVIDLETLICDFLWSGRKPKLKRTILIKNLEEGGINMPDKIHDQN
jgi:hypothetical protein